MSINRSNAIKQLPPVLQPKHIQGLADGSYTFSVYAVDAANNADPTPATWTFTVGIAPDTSIISAVDGQNNAVSNGGNNPQILSHSHSLELTM